MKIKYLVANSRRRLQRSLSAFSLVEVTVAMGVIGTAVLALFSGFTTGFFTMEMARENLRATQIMLEKTETLRLYNWDQVNDSGFIKTNFISPYDPTSTNLTSGILYNGTVTISPAPVPASYSNDMRMVTIGLNWKTGSLHRNRSFTTYIARNGLQTYIY
jgi:uncharacterized protein (TIGR02598 family)